ncbi:MAG: hypothetical protein NWE81_02900 [Candidatus Bathyarchaeota archaeon]|jgi:hypothetical protein|nr:hypothetical protein [Candidatus Bathyarchaeota archaeon]
MSFLRSTVSTVKEKVYEAEIQSTKTSSKYILILARLRVEIEQVLVYSQHLSFSRTVFKENLPHFAKVLNLFGPPAPFWAGQQAYNNI